MITLKYSFNSNEIQAKISKTLNKNQAQTVFQNTLPLFNLLQNYCMLMLDFIREFKLFFMHASNKKQTFSGV